MRRDITGAERAFLDAAVDEVRGDAEAVYGLEFRKFNIMRETLVRENQQRHPDDRVDFARLGPPTIAMCASFEIGDEDLFTPEQCAVIKHAREISDGCRFERMMLTPQTADMNDVQGLHSSLAIKGYYQRDPKYRRGHALLEFHACANYLRGEMSEIETGESMLFVARVMETYGYHNICPTELVDERLALMKKHHRTYFADDAEMLAQITELEQRYQPLLEKAATGFLEMNLRRDILLQKKIAADPGKYQLRDDAARRDYAALLQQYADHSNLPPPPRPLREVVDKRVSDAQQRMAAQQQKLKAGDVPVSEWSGRIARKDIKNPLRDAPKFLE